MVWGGVSQPHPTELSVIAGNLNAVSYREDIPSCGTLPACSSSHTARSVCDFLQDRNVSVLPWPAKSPILNPFERVWDLLDRRVRARAIPHRNVWELAGALVEESHSNNWQIWCSP